MANDNGELAATLADNIRRLRLARKLTLAELAQRSGVGKATLSIIEARRGNPRLETIRDLAEQLGVGPDELLTRSADATPQVVRAGEGVDISDGVIAGRLIKGLNVPPSVIELYEIRLPPGASEISTSHGVGAHEHAYVLRGTVMAGPVSGEPVRLSAADYAGYLADEPHVWRNVGKSEARVLIVQIMPTAANAEL